jgi:hypothetical protein
MWCNLAWFGHEFREGGIRLITRDSVNVHRFVAQQRNFSHDDVLAMIDGQSKIPARDWADPSRIAGVRPHRGQYDADVSPDSAASDRHGPRVCESACLERRCRVASRILRTPRIARNSPDLTA